jgi:hypothetical protein
MLECLDLVQAASCCKLLAFRVIAQEVIRLIRAEARLRLQGRWENLLLNR